MTKNVFSVPVFFIILRETIEAGIVISILLSFVEQLTKECAESLAGTTLASRVLPSHNNSEGENATRTEGQEGDDVVPDSSLTRKQLLRKLRIQIWAGAICGFLIALAIGGAFIGVFYSNQVHDLWAKSEELWEGCFNIIASILILVMALAFLKLEQAKVKWRIKLAHAFEKSTNARAGERGGRRSRWALFLLPFITVLREGLEAVVFAGGVSLGAQATAIPLAVVVGIIAGVFVSYILYRSASQLTLHFFLVVSTSILLLVGAGLFSTACGDFQRYVFNRGVGGDISEVGDGPGSFDVNGNVWHLTYGNPESGANRGGGWGIFNSILGWTNTATLGSVLCYVFYWIFVTGLLVWMKWSEGRTQFGPLKIRSSAYKARLEAKTAASDSASEKGDAQEVGTPTKEVV